MRSLFRVAGLSGNKTIPDQNGCLEAVYGSTVITLAGVQNTDIVVCIGQIALPFRIAAINRYQDLKYDPRGLITAEGGIDIALSAKDITLLEVNCAEIVLPIAVVSVDLDQTFKRSSGGVKAVQSSAEIALRNIYVPSFCTREAESKLPNGARTVRILEMLNDAKRGLETPEGGDRI